MAPLHSYSKWNVRETDKEEKIEPYRKYYIIAEGMNTERWYFEELINQRKTLGIHPMIDIRYLERTEEDEGRSFPSQLIELARKHRETKDFDKDLDYMIVVFDTDIFEREDARAIGLEGIIEDGSKDLILGLTNPSFELFLLLHFDNAYDEDIKGKEKEIIANKKVGNQRYINVLLKKHLPANTKHNNTIKSLVDSISTAIEQEKKINQDIYTIHGQVTSNIGTIIEKILNDKPESYNAEREEEIRFL